MTPLLGLEGALDFNQKLITDKTHKKSKTSGWGSESRGARVADASACRPNS